MADKKKVLICEDEGVIREFVVINLVRAGYDVVGVSSGEEAISVFESQGPFDIAVLDIMLPGIDGFNVCKTLRKADASLGIIMLSAKTQEMDKVNGLMLGADDYMTKPFSPGELVARIDALCRRIDSAAARAEQPPITTCGNFTIDRKNKAILKDGINLDLTTVEFQILELLIRNAGECLARDVILSEVWGELYTGDEKIVDVNVRRLRVKLENDPASPEHLTTVWGLGYKWVI
jgi:Response regulators consisting of a CheY-like receiver domain and a winged-helix DNA-binding domain